MQIRNRHLRRWLAASLVAAAVAVPAAQAGGPDERALYRGGDPALVPTSQSPDDRALYRGSSVNLAAAGFRPDDRPFSRSVREIDPGTRSEPAAATPAGPEIPYLSQGQGVTAADLGIPGGTAPDDRAVSVTPRGFDWGAAAIGGTFGLALALVVAAAALLATQGRLGPHGRKV